MHRFGLGLTGLCKVRDDNYDYFKVLEYKYLILSSGKLHQSVKLDDNLFLPQKFDTWWTRFGHNISCTVSGPWFGPMRDRGQTVDTNWPMRDSVQVVATVAVQRSINHKLCCAPLISGHPGLAWPCCCCHHTIDSSQSSAQLGKSSFPKKISSFVIIMRWFYEPEAV